MVRKWGVHLRDFPRGADDRADIAESLIEMVVSKTALEWLRDAVISTGRLICFAELRGIYCTRYRPLDGIEGSASIAIGYRPKDQEMRAIKAHGEMKLLPPSPPDPEIQTVQAYRKLTMHKTVDRVTAKLARALKPTTSRRDPPGSELVMPDLRDMRSGRWTSK